MSPEHGKRASYRRCVYLAVGMMNLRSRSYRTMVVTIEF
jgi:hypothetical protein